MAYLDRTTGTGQRAFTLIAVALLESVAIVAVIHGLTVHFTSRPPERRFVGEQWKLPPPPPQPQPSARPKPHEAVIAKPTRRPEVPRLVYPVLTDPLPLPLPVPQPLPTGGIDLPPLPPSSGFVARQARPRNDPGAWVTPDDYPSREIRDGHQGTAHFRLAVGADGSVQSCKVTQSTGFAGLDAATCRYIARRARFEPATDAAGKSVAGSYAGSIRWVIPRG